MHSRIRKRKRIYAQGKESLFGSNTKKRNIWTRIYFNIAAIIISYTASNVLLFSPRYYTFWLPWLSSAYTRDQTEIFNYIWIYVRFRWMSCLKWEVTHPCIMNAKRSFFLPLKISFKRFGFSCKSLDVNVKSSLMRWLVLLVVLVAACPLEKLESDRKLNVNFENKYSTV